MTHKITRGDDETLTVLVTDEDTGLPIDITGSTLTFMVKRLPTDADVEALITKETPTEIVLSNQVTDTGKATIEIEATETDVLRPGLRHWELQSVDLTGEVKTLAYGHLLVQADMIRGGVGS